jgi:hypothetical protein
MKKLLNFNDDKLYSYLKKVFHRDLTESEFLECKMSMIHLGRAISRYLELKRQPNRKQ